jgi:hypothetical protein
MTNQNPNVRNERGEVYMDEALSAVPWLIGIAAVVSLVIHGYSSPDQSTDPNKVGSYQSAKVACAMPSQTGPNRASMDVTRDNRVNMIYPCNYFEDMGLQPNTKLKLGEVTEETFDNNITDGQIDGSLSGWALLGSGVINGGVHGKLHSETKRERLYLVNVQDSDGNYVFTTLDKAEKVRVARCDEADADCKPSIEFKTDEEPLWFKEPGKDQHFPLDSVSRDTTSIWDTGDTFGDHERGNTLDVRRNQIVGLLTQNGTPLPPGQVAAELSQEIILTIPQS